LNQFKRDRNNEGAVIATLEDFDWAQNLWRSVETAQSTGLTKSELKVLEVIASKGTIGISFTELTKTTGMNSGTLSRIINGKSDGTEHKGGLLNNVDGLYTTQIDRSTLYYFSGDLTLHESVVSLTNRQEAQAIVDSCTGCVNLQMQASGIKPISTT
jgi:DNA-binding Xre family transcriptional regulator